MKKGILTFISVNSFQTLPPVKQFYEYFKEIYKITVIHCAISNLENYFTECDEHTLFKFNDYKSFLHQNSVVKIKKYFNLITNFYLNSFVKGNTNQIQLIITNELFPLMLSLLFKRRNQVIIYHQFEVVKPGLINNLDKFCLYIVKLIIYKLDIVIIPEINRIEFFKKIIGKTGKTSYYLLPNTNDNLYKPCEPKYGGKKVVAHIGSIGEDSFIKELLEAFKMLENVDVELWIIGSLDTNIFDIIKSYNLKNIILLGHLNHSELLKKYKDIDIGLILYRGMELNTLYCAPNKLYEYWSFGIPVVGHRLPGLTGVFNKRFMGTVIDMSQPNEIFNTIRKILRENYSSELSKYFRDNLRAKFYYRDLEHLINSKYNI